MANPPIAIGPFDNVPAAGSPIRSDWTQEISHHVTDYWSWISATSVPITGNVDAAAASFTDWLAVAVNVPTWATRALVTTTVARLFEMSAGGNSFELQTRVGQVAGPGVPVPAFPAVNTPATMAWTSWLSGLVAGSSTIAVMARRTWGTGVLRVDAASSCWFGISFVP